MYVLVHTYVYIDTYVCMYLHVRFSFVCIKCNYDIRVQIDRLFIFHSSTQILIDSLFTRHINTSNEHTNTSFIKKNRCMYIYIFVGVHRPYTSVNMPHSGSIPSQG